MQQCYFPFQSIHDYIWSVYMIGRRTELRKHCGMSIMIQIAVYLMIHRITSALLFALSSWRTARRPL